MLLWQFGCLATPFYHVENHYGFFYLDVQLHFTTGQRIIITNIARTLKSSRKIYIASEFEKFSYVLKRHSFLAVDPRSIDPDLDATYKKLNCKLAKEFSVPVCDPNQTAVLTAATTGLDKQKTFELIHAMPDILLKKKDINSKYRKTFSKDTLTLCTAFRSLTNPQNYFHAKGIGGIQAKLQDTLNLFAQKELIEAEFYNNSAAIQQNIYKIVSSYVDFIDLTQLALYKTTNLCPTPNQRAYLPKYIRKRSKVLYKSLSHYTKPAYLIRLSGAGITKQMVNQISSIPETQHFLLEIAKFFTYEAAISFMLQCMIKAKSIREADERLKFNLSHINQVLPTSLKIDSPSTDAQNLRYYIAFSQMAYLSMQFLESMVIDCLLRLSPTTSDETEPQNFTREETVVSGTVQSPTVNSL